MSQTNDLPMVTCFSDGSTYPGNPGRGGWGALLILGDRVRAIYGTINYATNNYAEAAAVFHALSVLTKPCRVHVYTDSKYVINGLTRVNKSIARYNDDNILLTSNRELWMGMRPMASRHIVTASHVGGHSIYEYNELADELASLGSKNGETGSFYVHEIVQGSPEARLLQTVKRRVSQRQERGQKQAEAMALKKRGVGYSA